MTDEQIEKFTWMGISGIANVLCCIKTVSYTHLDVYKRQLLYLSYPRCRGHAHRLPAAPGAMDQTVRTAIEG